MTKLLIATTNMAKLRELSALLREVPMSLSTPQEEGIFQEIEEKGASLEENAILKAKGYMKLAGLPSLADDTALEVEALNGEPGLLSKRYGGLERASDSARVAYLLQRLLGTPWESRDARFRCTIALAWPQGEVETFQGECLGKIALESRGKGGFGYDSVFYVPELGKTMAQLSLEEKNQISHRSKAARQALKALKSRLGS